jgi:SAM-dependent methyltransferase
MYKPFENYFSKLSPNDGTMDFYSRVGSLAAPENQMLDFGAGRGEWFEDDKIQLRRQARNMRGRFGTVIACDIDPVVMSNNATDRNVIIENGHVPLDDASVDVIVADYVLEHIPDVEQFTSEIDRLLKPGGWFCARTPHAYHYVCIAARLMAGPAEDFIMKYAQPNRKEEDIFPKHYKLNTLKAISAAFPSWDNQSFIRRSDPAYYFGRRVPYNLMDFGHRIMPAAFSSNISIFLRKSPVSESGDAL